MNRGKTLVVLFAISVGCLQPSFGQQPLAPYGANPASVIETVCYSSSSSQQLESVYGSAINQEAANNECCVDLYFQAAALSWPVLENQLVNSGQMSGRVLQIYRSSLQQLIKTGQRFGRFDPRQGLRVVDNGGERFIPVVHQGFPRPATDFDLLIPRRSTGSSELTKEYRCQGLGVTVVVQHCRLPEESFVRDKQSFGATVVLRRAPVEMGVTTYTFMIEILDPLRINNLEISGRSVPIARDLSAAIVYVLETREQNAFQSFLHPGGTTTDSELFMLEPYQPGKIPLVFVHGLLSDRLTWANLANEIQAHPELLQRFQIWGFEYPTGQPFLTSAADFRQALCQIRAMMDPGGSDPALLQMVLVGHSMGGLLAKLQITHSGDELWQSISNRPLQSIVTSEEARNRLARAFYFNASPSVSRVIYMGTPHRGSPWARRPIGRIGAKLVEEPSANKEQHRQLICNNPNTFTRELEKRIPTSIDLLRPDSGLLLAIDRICVADRVKQNSIIGNYRRMLGAGPSDTVVPVSSAIRHGVESELHVRAKHSDIKNDQNAINELIRILMRHASEFGWQGPTPLSAKH